VSIHVIFAAVGLVAAHRWTSSKLAACIILAGSSGNEATSLAVRILVRIVPYCVRSQDVESFYSVPYHYCLSDSR
jgi:hypothetical protein